MLRRNKLTIGLVITTIVMIGGIFLMPLFDREFFNDDWMIILSYGAPYVVCFLVAMALSRVFCLRVPSLKLEVSQYNATFTLFGVIVIFASQVVLSPLVHLLPDYYINYIVENQPVLQQNGFYQQLTAIFIAPIVQQCVFRGIFQVNIERRFGAIWAIFGSALLYGITYLSPRDFVYMFGAGVAIAGIYYVTRSLATVIWINILFNGINYLYFMFFESWPSWYNILSDYTFVYVGVWTACALVLIITTWWVWHHMDKRLLESKFGKK